MADEILAKLGLDESSLDRGLRVANHQVQEFAHSTKEQFNDAFKELAAPFLAGGAAIGGIEMIFGKVEDIERVAAATGLTAEQYQRLAFAAKETGVQSEAVEKSLEFLSKTIGEAVAGGASQLKLFEKWGIAIKDAKGEALGVNEVFSQIVDKVYSMHSPTSKAAIDMDLLGKSGAKFVALMAQGNAAIQEIGKGASVITDKEIENLEKAKSLWGKIINFVIIYSAKGISATSGFFEHLFHTGSVWGDSATDKAEGEAETQRRIKEMQDATNARLMQKYNTSDPDHVKYTQRALELERIRTMIHADWGTAAPSVSSSIENHLSNIHETLQKGIVVKPELGE